ncbi:MAG TPA: hypothetical protein VJQ06_12530 [Rhizomicrobium sp.]|nr:hypothetical protein [Rhizomicrobium sp.]
MTRSYCCYFDHRYLPRGLAMIRSLRRFEPEAEVWVLCLSSTAHRELCRSGEIGVRLVTLEEIETGDESLLRAKTDGRSLVEYYFTLTPSLVRYVMARTSANIVSYLDSDLYFFSSPQPIYDEMGASSVLIIPHGFVAAMRRQERFGRYNVGWLSFRNDTSGRACLEWWRDRSNEWCSDVVDEVGKRYCEQRYLDRFAEISSGVHVLSHPGANLAPWNVAAHKLDLVIGKPLVDGLPLLFFHFHGLHRVGARRFFAIHWEYGGAMTRLMRTHLYRPYLAELLSIEREIKDFSGPSDILRAPGMQRGGGLMAKLRALMRLARAWRAGCVISVSG